MSINVNPQPGAGNVGPLRGKAVVPKDPEKGKPVILGSVHIHLNDNGEPVKIENRDDKDRNTYIYDSEGNVKVVLPPGGKIEGI